MPEIQTQAKPDELDFRTYKNDKTNKENNEIVDFSFGLSIFSAAEKNPHPPSNADTDFLVK
ncbi:hypothetical protein ACSHXX_03440 [Neisseria meningitidis]